MIIAVIPAYNEEKTISNVIKGVKKYCKVMVVDDGSTDKTKQIAEKEGAIVISHGKNKGYGQALRTGINKALKFGAKTIITIDGDGQHNPNDIPHFIKALDFGADIVSGSRFLFYEIRCSWRRKLAIKALTTLAYFLTDLHLSDIQSGFRAYNSKIFKDLKLNDSSMGFSVELPIKAKKKGFTFMEIPIEIRYFHKIKSFWAALKQGITVGKSILKHSLK